MPKHSGGVGDKGDPQAPRLHCRRARRLNIELAGEVQRLDLRPPGVEVVDHKLHHEVFGEVLLIEALKYEATGTGPEDRYLSINKFFEAERLIELFRNVE